MSIFNCIEKILPPFITDPDPKDIIRRLLRPLDWLDER